MNLLQWKIDGIWIIIDKSGFVLAWDLNERMGGVEVSFGRVGSLVVGCNLGQSIEAAADRLEESPFGVFFREDCLNEMRELRDDKVNQRKVAQSPLLSSNEFLKLGQLPKLGQLASIFFKYLLPIFSLFLH